MMGNRLVVMTVIVIIVAILAQLFLLDALLQVNLCVSFLFIGSGEFTPAGVATEWLLASVRSDVRRQVVGTREGSHANSALERLLPGVNSDVASELIRSREAAVAIFDGASVGALVNWRLARTIWIFARLHWD